jgi:hypothetical protein
MKYMPISGMVAEKNNGEFLLSCSSLEAEKQRQTWPCISGMGSVFPVLYR